MGQRVIASLQRFYWLPATLICLIITWIYIYKTFAVKLMPAQRDEMRVKNNQIKQCVAVSFLCKHDDEQKKNSNLTPPLLMITRIIEIWVNTINMDWTVWTPVYICKTRYHSTSWSINNCTQIDFKRETMIHFERNKCEN